MSRRAHLYELTRQLRRQLTWQQAQGVDAFVPADATTRQRFEARQKAHRDREIADLRSQITDEPATAPVQPKKRAAKPKPAKEKPPHRAPMPNKAAKKKRSQTATQEVAPNKVTASTPLWKKHDPIHEISRKKREQAQSAVAASRDGRPAPPPSESPSASPSQPSQRPQKPQTPAEKMAFLRHYLGDCQRCPLHQERTTIVFGDGDVNARLMFIGEGPGRNEDKQGLPFVGKSGDLLTKMIGAMGFERSQVYITNVVKCRPPGNRNPAPMEIKECSPFLKKQIEVIEPEAIVTLGRFASNALLQSDEALGKMRGRWHEAMGVAVMPTYHPAYLLRNEGDRGLKKKVWSDLQMVMARLGLES